MGRPTANTGEMAYTHKLYVRNPNERDLSVSGRILKRILEKLVRTGLSTVYGPAAASCKGGNEHWCKDVPVLN
jgi:hypothetical protein